MINRVALTGHFTRLDGTPDRGTVLIRPSRSPILDLNGMKIISGPQRFPLDEDGRFSVDLPPTDDPALGENFTYDVMVTLYHTSWQVLGLSLPSDRISVDVLDPPAGVVKEFPTRAEWDALTGAAVAEMEAALAGAETARDTTVDARDITVVARDETITARDETFTARNTADGAARIAWNARTETLNARDTTLAARDATVEARDETLTARTETITAAGEAEAARDEAVGALGEAETARDEAIGAAGEAETARQSAWEAVDTPGRQGPPGEVTTAALTSALAGKVTGTDMTVRVDNTVGTRVLLDHPGGSVMLHGDTGWRTLPPGDWTVGTLQIRRVGATVSLRVGNLESVGGSEPQIPDGFRPNSSTRWLAQASYNPSSSQSGRILMVFRTLRIVGTITEPLWATVPTEFTWITTDPWPTVSPGTPL